MKNGVRYEEFWGLTPKSLEDIIWAKTEKIKEDMTIRDVLNWQLGQYIQCAIAGCFNKRGNNYPQKPLFSAENMSNKAETMSEEDKKEFQLMKLMTYLENGNKNISKGGKHG